MSQSEFTAVAPGRLCLFGEHQDYLSLPVIACAIPLQCRIHVTPTKERILDLTVPALQQHFQYDLDQLPPRQTSETPANTMDFALAAIHEAIQDGWDISCGAKCISTTNIVMQAGCSSSTAFTTAWTLVLSRLASRPLAPLQLAQRAHQAEVRHFGAPGGTMDHVAIAMGSAAAVALANNASESSPTQHDTDGTCIRIGPGMWDVQILPTLSMPEPHGIWILADSGQPKDTMKHLKRCKGDRLALLEKMGGTWGSEEDGVNVNAANSDSLTEDEQTLLKATRINRDMEEQAAALWMSIKGAPAISGQPYDDMGKMLAKLMDTHHQALRDGLHLSTDRLEAMRSAALEAGAWGFKLVGSGGGGCGVAWVPVSREEAVSEAMKQAGAVATWPLQKAHRGAYIED